VRRRNELCPRAAESARRQAQPTVGRPGPSPRKSGPPAVIHGAPPARRRVRPARSAGPPPWLGSPRRARDRGGSQGGAAVRAVVATSSLELGIDMARWKPGVVQVRGGRPRWPDRAAGVPAGPRAQRRRRHRASSAPQVPGRTCRSGGGGRALRQVPSRNGIVPSHPAGRSLAQHIVAMTASRTGCWTSSTDGSQAAPFGGLTSGFEACWTCWPVANRARVRRGVGAAAEQRLRDRVAGTIRARHRPPASGRHHRSATIAEPAASACFPGHLGYRRQRAPCRRA